MRIELQADVYDALELSSLAFGGVGGGAFSDYEGCPLCIRGHAIFLDDGNGDGDVSHALWSAFGMGRVVAINDDLFSGAQRRDRTRISFAEWCKRLNVVRASR